MVEVDRFEAIGNLIDCEFTKCSAILDELEENEIRIIKENMEYVQQAKLYLKPHIDSIEPELDAFENEIKSSVNKSVMKYLKNSYPNIFFFIISNFLFYLNGFIISLLIIIKTCLLELKMIKLLKIIIKWYFCRAL